MKFLHHLRGLFRERLQSWKVYRLRNFSRSFVSVTEANDCVQFLQENVRILLKHCHLLPSGGNLLVSFQRWDSSLLEYWSIPQWNSWVNSVLFVILCDSSELSRLGLSGTRVLARVKADSLSIGPSDVSPRKWHYRDPLPPRTNDQRWILSVTRKHSAWSSDPRMTICTLPALLHEVSIHRHATRLHPLCCPSSPSFPVRRRCRRELTPQPATYDWRHPRTHRRCSIPRYCQQQHYHQCHGPPTSPDRATGRRCDSRKWRWKTSGAPRT